MKQKILIIAPCLSMGGMERASVNTANGLYNSEKIRVVFVSLFKKEHFFTLNKEVKLIEPKGFNGNRLAVLKTIHWIRTIVKAENPDSILVFNKFYAALTALALVRIRIPFFISERSSPLFVWKQPLKLFNRLAFWLKPPTGTIAQTTLAAEHQQKYFKKSIIKVIPNMLRPIELYPDIKRGEIILAVGRLGDSLKGFDLLIESFAILTNKSWELQIAGGDDNGQYLKDLASKLGVLDRVKFLGKVKEIDKVYAQAGVFVIPSRSEGFPNALAEAMASGCACISFDFIAGPRDMIEHGVNGFIVEDGNIDLMATTIENLIDSPKLRDELGEKAMGIRARLNSCTIVNEIIKFVK